MGEVSQLGEVVSKILSCSDHPWFLEEILKAVQGGLQGVAANLSEFHSGVFSDTTDNFINIIFILTSHQRHHFYVISPVWDRGTAHHTHIKRSDKWAHKCERVESALVDFCYPVSPRTCTVLFWRGQIEFMGENCIENWIWNQLYLGYHHSRAPWEVKVDYISGWFILTPRWRGPSG